MKELTSKWFNWYADSWDKDEPFHDQVGVEVIFNTGENKTGNAESFNWRGARKYIVYFRLLDAPNNDILESAYNWCIKNLKELPPMSECKPPKKHGGSSPNQYRKSLELPLSGDRSQFATVDIEVMDICEAWGFQQEEHNLIKAFARSGKKDSGNPDYDARKVMLFALRYAKREGMYTHKEFWEHCKTLGLSEDI